MTITLHLCTCKFAIEPCDRGILHFSHELDSFCLLYVECFLDTTLSTLISHIIVGHIDFVNPTLILIMRITVGQNYFQPMINF